MRTRTAFSSALLLFFASAALAAPPRFAAPFLSYASGFDARAVAIADVNNDGKPDVLVSNTAGLEVRLGAGDGTLGPALITAAPRSPYVVIGDIDGDGKQDVLIAADSMNAAVRIGNGDGTFQAAVTYFVAKGPGGAALADLNDDGWLDMLCTARDAHALTIRLGVGGGIFGGPTHLAVGTQPSAVATADLDHDGDVDAVVADRGPAALHRLHGDGSGSLASLVTTSLPVMPGTLALADLNGDTWLDAVVGSISSAQFVVVPGSPGGSFGAPATHAVGSVTSGIAVVDFDADGRPDVAVLDYDLNRGEMRRGLGAFAFAAAQPFAAARNAWGIASADLNGGGKPDLVTICPYGPLSVHMGNGDGTFGGVQDLATGPSPWAIASGDLDADGHADLVTTNTGNGTLSVRFGTGSAAFTSPATLTTGVEPHGLVIADADGDGHLDIVVAENGPGFQSSGTVAVFLGDGERGFAARAPYTVGRWPQEVAVGDLTGDGLPELAVACNDGPPATLTVLQNLGGAQWGNRQDFTLGSNATGVAIGDVTRDGKPDVVLCASYTNSVHVLPGNANGTYGSQFSFEAISVIDVAIADVAGDAANDVIASRTGGLSVFPSEPGGGFGPRVDHAGGSGWMTVADLDGDGRADVANANHWPASTVSVWFGQTGGGLGPGTAFGGGDRPFGVTSADFDEDGTLDLACANLASGTISLLLNTGGVAWLPWLDVPPSLPATGLALRLVPNPAHGPVTIRCRLPRAAHVGIRLLDIAGRQLAEVERGDRPAGEWHVEWSTRGLPAGVCFLELIADGERTVQRVVLLP